MRSSTRQNSVKPGDNPVQKQEKKTARNPVKPSKTLDFVNRCLNQCWMELTFFLIELLVSFGFTEVYWVEMSTTGLHLVFIGFYLVLLGFTGF